MKISSSGRRLEVKLHCDDDDRAWMVSKHNRALPPTGYTWISSFFRGRRKYGRGIDLILVFLLNDRAVDPIEEPDAYQLFEEDKAVARGSKLYAPHDPDAVQSEHPD